ncbi:hypothetical protein [Streptomyces sp. MAR4 CNX-425]|uniref:preprotein translocase subunit SecA n=1 Tax=Streptomyces sp. MAR4 CNX-425 TaxID=3406343 RepID=UPI003B50CFBA
MREEQLARDALDLRRRCIAGEAPAALAPRAWHLVREAAPNDGPLEFDEADIDLAVALTGGVVLHGGSRRGPERMRSVRLLATFLLALGDQGVHVIAPGESQAAQEARITGPVLRKLGMSVEVLAPDFQLSMRQKAYAAEVTFGSFDQFAHDQLRENQRTTVDESFRRGSPAALVIEINHLVADKVADAQVLTVLREPDTRILSGLSRFVESLERGEHFTVGPGPSVWLTPSGRDRLHHTFGTGDTCGYQAVNLEVRAQQAIHAEECARLGQDYDIVDGAVELTASTTVPEGLAYSGGLRQAIEAKEGLTISRTEWVVGTTTVIEYLRGYRTLSGTTTARVLTAQELEEILGIEVRDLRGDDELGDQRSKQNAVEERLLKVLNVYDWSRPGSQWRAALNDYREQVVAANDIWTLVRDITRWPGGEARKENATADAVVEVGEDELKEGTRWSFLSAVDQAVMFSIAAESAVRKRYWPADHSGYLAAIETVHSNIDQELKALLLGNLPGAKGG